MTVCCTDGVLAVCSQFSGLIGFIFFLELTAAVLVVVFQGQVRDWINDFFLNNIKAYRDDIDLQNLIDSLQRLVGRVEGGRGCLGAGLTGGGAVSM